MKHMHRLLISGLLLLSLLLAPSVPAAAAASSADNLVLGMAYTITNSLPTAHSYSRYEDETGGYDQDHGQLTDGTRAGEDLRSDAWYRAFRSRSRYITFDFDRPVSIAGFSAGFYHGSGYYAPRYVRLYLSNDGDSWFCAGETQPDFSLQDSARRYDASWSTQQPYAARYVRLEFCCDIFACCDEIELYGSKTLSGTEQSFIPDTEEETFYCTGLEGDPYGVTDIIKLYNGYYPAAQDLVKNTVEDLLPYVAYLLEDGKIADTMFDAVAFVPCVSTNFAYPSGGTLVKTSRFPSAVQSDWIFYTDFLFEPGYELDALNQAVEQVYSALGMEGKFPVLLTMPYPGVIDGAFGDLDGDGQAEYCRTTGERIAVVNWYDQYLSKRLLEADFSRLDVIGYYWYAEEVNYTWSPDEAAFTTGALQALKDAGKVVLFDAFYLSTGFDHWQDLGFSGAVMQPNVAFTDSRPYFELPMLEEFAEAAGTYHLGVEIETNEPSAFRSSAVAEACRNYERYLYVGAKSGYMRSLHTFYQGAGPGSLYDFCHADTGSAAGARLRRLYDCTYAFLKEQYQNLPPEVTVPDAVSATPGQRLTIPLSVSDPDSHAGDLVLMVSCEHGRAQVGADRTSLLYLPQAEYHGTDCLTLTVTDGQNEVQTYTISVSVQAAASEESVQESAGADLSDASASGLWLWLLPGLVLLAGVAGVGIWVLKRKGAA